MDPKYYQGMLRKHQQLNEQVDRLMRDDSSIEAIKAALENPAIQGSRRPKDQGREVELLWELRQTNDMLSLADQAIPPTQQRQISVWERFVAALRSMFSIEKNPADRPVEELRELLTDSITKAETATAEPGSRLDYSPTEFCTDPKVAQNSEINVENSSRKIAEFISKNKDELSSSSISHLEHRFKACQKVERLEKNSTYRAPTEGCTFSRGGKEISQAEFEPGDKIMLNGVHERRSQNTLNGCWSVSLCSQLEYRGVNLTQEDIRAYRPNNKEIEGSVDKGGAAGFSENIKQTITAYYGLAARTMPNAVGHHYVNVGTSEKSRNELRNVITHALTKDNSPLSICANGHYRTIVGIEGDRVFFKDPLRIVGRPEGVDSMTLQEIQKLGSRSMGVELSWFKDLKPTLGGSSMPDSQLMANGISYRDGVVSLPSLDKGVDWKNNIMLRHNGPLVMQSPHSGGVTSVEVTMFMPKVMAYNRLPGGKYNADALDSMMQTLSAIPTENRDTTVTRIQEHAEAMKNGIYKDDPTEGMLEMAKLYQEVIRGLEGDTPRNTQLLDTLQEQLGEIRTAVVENTRGRYQAKVGDPQNNLLNMNKFENPADEAEKKLFDARKAYYENVKEGMAGMLYLHTVVRETDIMDSKWIDALRGENVAKGVGNVKQDAAFGNMIENLYENASRYQYYIADVVSARNRVESLQKEYDTKAKAEERNKDKKVEAAQLKEKIENSDKSKEKTLAEVKAELEEAKAWKETVDSRDPKERSKFMKELGLDENEHLNPYIRGCTSKPEVLREKLEVTKLDGLRRAVRGGDATELFGRYMKEQHKLLEQEKKEPEHSAGKEKEGPQSSRQKETLSSEKGAMGISAGV